MARTINVAGKEYKRVDSYWLPPEEVVAERPINVRFDLDGSKLDHQKVITYAFSFLKEGQQHACPVREVGEKRVALISGYHRHAAALLVKLGDKKLGIEPHPDFKLHVDLLQDVNPEDALVNSVVENELRNVTTHMDRAVVLKELRRIGKEDTEIARLFGRGTYDESGNFRPDLVYIRKLEKLNLLTYDLQKRVHLGEIALNFACTLAEMSETDRQEVLAEATRIASESSQTSTVDAVIGQPLLPVSLNGSASPNGAATVPAAINEHLTGASAAEADKVLAAATPGGKITAESLRTAIRKKSTSKGKAVGRSYKEVKDYFLSIAGPAEEPPVMAFGNAVLDFCEGRIEKDDLDGALVAFRQNKVWKPKSEKPAKNRQKRVAKTVKNKSKQHAKSGK